MRTRLDVLDQGLVRSPLRAIARSLQVSSKGGQVKHLPLLALAGALVRKNKFLGIARDLATLVRGAAADSGELFVALSILRSVARLEEPRTAFEELDTEWRQLAKEKGFDAMVRLAESKEQAERLRNESANKSSR